MAAYYNEIDGHAAQWLRNLIGAGHIPPGDVDERSIVDVDPADIDGYGQCHFFAGIGGWPYALHLAGWPDDRPVWTGSCPCQPISSAGQRKGHADERHLWPAFYGLIAERRPAAVFGEQVAGTLGREWLAGVRADLEAAGYAVGAADLCAASVGAPHIRQRLFWVADAGYRHGTARISGCLDEGRSIGARPAGGCATGRLGDTDAPGLSPSEPEALCGTGRRDERRATAEPGPPRDFWSRAEWLRCLDGKARRVESGIFPLADGIPARVGKLRAAGNAIVPQVAAEFVASFVEARP